MSCSAATVRLAARVYAAALVVCPRALRARYGVEMRETFADRCREAARGGAPAVAGVLARELADLAVAALSARRPHTRPVALPATGLHSRSRMMGALWHD